MFDPEDEGTRIGVCVALAAVVFVVAGVVGGVALRALKPKVEHGPDAMVDAPLAGTLAGKLYFDSGVATLPADAAAVLRPALQALAEPVPARKLVIAPFHDSRGDPTRHRELARRRALAARDALRDAGADPARIVLRRPEAVGEDSSLQEARRVELRIVE